VEVFQGLAYVAAAKGLWAVDFEDPRAPSVAGVFPIDRDDQHPQDVTLYNYGEGGVVAYLSTWSDGVRVVDMSDPAEPVQLARIQTKGAAEEVKLVYGYNLFVASGKEGVELFNVLDPRNPTPQPIAQTKGHAWALEVNPSQGRGYVAFGRLGKKRPDGTFDKTGGLEIFDFSVPE
jgi:hypothetical protein